MRRGATHLLALALLSASLCGCRRRSVVAAGPSDGGDAAAANLPPPLPPSPATDVTLDMLEASPRCRIEHRGALVDLGAPEAAWSTPGRPDAATDVPGFERDGTTWGRVLDRAQSFTVAVDATGPALVSVRGRALGAKKAVATVDGKVVGVLVLTPGEDKVVTVTSNNVTLTPGLHVVGLRWVGAVKKDEPLAELDWIRLGVVDDDPSTYAAPTRRQAIAQVAIGGVPRKAWTLMAPAVIRCVAWVPPGASLATDVGAIGEGSDGEVELRERGSSGDVPRVLGKQAASAHSWAGLSAPLSIGGEKGGIGIVEIAVTKAPKQGRVAIAEPRVVRPSSAPRPATDAGSGAPLARSAIVVVMAGLGSSQATLPSLLKLGREGVTFSGHRAPSPLAPASLASLVTGLPVPVHALEDPGARLSPRTALLGKSLARFGVESAMFTEVPPTGPAFGFAHDWTHYAARSPLDGPPIAFDEVSKFLQGAAGKKLFVVAHARGAHPPWEISAEALKSLPPENYAGMVDPKHVVAILGKVRRGLLRLNEADRARMVALADNALAAQDRRLDAFVEELRTAGTLDQTLLVVTGDAPFVIPPASEAKGPMKAEREPSLAEAGDDAFSIPLVVRFPGARAAGAVVGASTDPTDVAATIVSWMGGPVDELAGRDLLRLALDEAPARSSARLADDGRSYQLAWGELRLSGTWGKMPVLRLKGVTEDQRTLRPHEYLAAWGLAAEARDRWLSARAKGPGREPATVDGATAAAMETWERPR